MNFLKGLFKQKEQPIKTNQDFWDWFVKNEKVFFNSVKDHRFVEQIFFDKLSPKLAELKQGFFFLTGMTNDTTAELVLTADGAIEHIAFVEDLVAAAPKLDNWMFTALKQPSTIENTSIEMSGYKFNADNIFFYAEEYADRPDEIDIKVTHTDLTEENKEAINIGIFIFLDNYLGELNFATMVDNLSIIRKDEAEKEWIAIKKLKPFLIWREKEFIEKYEGTRHNTDEDGYSSFEATMENGMPIMGIINTDLMQWDAKASHPWIAAIEVKYDGSANNGMPNDTDYQLMNHMEDELMTVMKDVDGYLNLGRETGSNERMIYFACKEFRKPSKALYQMKQKYQQNFQISYSIYKDKYWSSLERFVPQY